MDVNIGSPGPNATNDGNDRPSCLFGEMCYRTNPSHRAEEAHPGDSDYSVRRMPSPQTNAPKCQYGRNCYRLNPEHFVNYNHPRNTNPQENLRKRRLRNGAINDDSDSDMGGYGSNEDPFAVDADDSDYVPSEGDD